MGERADTDAGRRHRVILAGGVPLPGGFRGSVVAEYASEAPFNVVTGEDEDKDGFVTERPDGLGRNAGENVSLDVVNELRALNGLAPVLQLDEPDFLQIDVRLSRPFALGAGTAGELFVQVFNVFDRVNVGEVEGRIIAGRFGEANGLAGPPRTLEAGLRVAF